MYLGVITAAFLDQPLNEVVPRMASLGVRGIELPAGGFFPTEHCDPAALLIDESERNRLLKLLADNDMTLTAYALHGNQLHPDPIEVEKYTQQFRNTCQLASMTGVDRITLLSGQPAAGPDDKFPNFILFPFPPELVKAYEWQWEHVAIPWWRENAQYAADLGIKLCIEPVPGNLVHNPEMLLRLRDAVNDVAPDTVGCNLDPSHFFWQGINTLDAIRELGDTIYHVHGKDSRVDPSIARVNGVLDPKPFTDVAGRGWSFRTIGYGHDQAFWRDFVSTLRAVGYDDVISIETEDLLFDPDEGFELSVQTLRNAIVEKPAQKLWYA